MLLMLKIVFVTDIYSIFHNPGLEYIGCFTNTALFSGAHESPAMRTSLSATSVGLCVAYCQSQGFMHAGLTNGRVCRCITNPDIEGINNFHSICNIAFTFLET